MTNAALDRNPFAKANPHALATILEASETRRIIAATDIFDISGIKLWAVNQPVSVALQRKLLDRQLRQPLETCLIAEDGVTPVMLVESLRALVEGSSPLAPILKPHAAKLAREASHLPLHPVAQLLLTARQSTRPERFEHAVAAMALAGAMLSQHGGDTSEVRIAMLCGLLHDLGEMYIDPHMGEADVDCDLDFLSYQQLVVHPHVGHLLLAQLTQYPRVVAQAVAEHHERLDGSGYPHAIGGDRISPFGRMLAVTEAALHAMRGGGHLLRASVALRAVPGEFDMHWVGELSHAAASQPPLMPVLEPREIAARLVAIGELLKGAEARVIELLPQASQPGLKGALELSQFLLWRLRVGWNASGLWNPAALTVAEAAELESLEDELYGRLRGIERAARLRAGDLPPADLAALDRLCDSLAMVG